MGKQNSKRNNNLLELVRVSVKLRNGKNQEDVTKLNAILAELGVTLSKGLMEAEQLMQKKKGGG